MLVRFLHPELANWLLALPATFACWLIYQAAKWRFRRGLDVGQPLLAVSRLSSTTYDVTTLAMIVVTVGMLGVAIMRPQILLSIQTPRFEQHDLILMLDRSASMHARDITPSRFHRALDEIAGFLARKPDTVDRVALVGFAGTALVLSQLTSDADGLFFYLDYMRDDEQLYWDTNIGAALNAAREVARRDREHRPKIFVVLSDGEDFGRTLSTALGTYQREQTRVHTIGIGGDNQVPITVTQGGVSKLLENESGQVMRTRYSAVTLTNIARTTGGHYFRSTTGRELTQALEDIVSFERKLVGWTASVEYRDLHREALFMALCAGALLLLKI